MDSFKTFWEKKELFRENRRNFLKTLFGTGAVATVSNPVAIADTIAKQAGLPWIELKLFTGQSLAPFAAFSVDAENIDALKSQQGMVPGVNKSGDIMIDYNNSDLGEMTVFVKPGSKLHARARGLVGTVERGEHDFSLENGLGDDVQKELGKTIHDTINDFDGDGSTWLEQEIEKEKKYGEEYYENLPDHQKDGYEDVDEDSYPSVSQKGATDKASNLINQGVEHFGAEIGEPVKNVIGRGYMKSYALGAGSGDEATMQDSMVELRDVYDDQQIDDPDEDDVYRWMEGEADDPYDTYNDGRADWKDDYQQDMDQVTGDEDQDDIEDWITAGFNFLMGASQKQEQVPVKHLLNVPNFHDALKKGRMINGSKFNMSGEPDMNEPLQISHDGREPIEIIGGFEQLAAADEDKIAVPRVQMIHVDELQTEPESTSKYLDNENI